MKIVEESDGTWDVEEINPYKRKNIHLHACGTTSHSIQ
jgi:hypothetical protein